MMSRKSAATFMVVLTGVLIICCTPATSADFPAGMIKLIVTAGAGGGEDAEARTIAPFAEKHLRQKIIIENQAAAGGKVAFTRFQKTKPDGYSLITYTFPKSVIIEFLEKVNYKTSDFTPIFGWSRSYQSLVVHAESWKTIDEFMNAAKSRTLTGGLSGRGSTSHLTGLIAVEKLGIKVKWVPYDGSGESLSSLAGKHIDFTITQPSSASSLIQAGKVRPLLLLSDERDPDMPGLMIPKEMGIDMDFIPALRGVEAPPNTPPTIVNILEDAFSKAAMEPGFIEIAKKRKMDLHPTTRQEFAKIVSDVYPRIAAFQQMLKE